jgi:hypothetical protein
LQRTGLRGERKYSKEKHEEARRQNTLHTQV